MAQSIPFPSRESALFIVLLLLFLSDHGFSFTIRIKSSLPFRGCNTRINKLGPSHVPNASKQAPGLSFPFSPSLVTTTATSANGGGDDDNKVLDRERRSLDDKQQDFVLGYLNKHHGNLLIKFAETFSQLGVEKAKKNAWTGNAYNILSAKLVGIDTKAFELEVEIKERGDSTTTKTVEVDLGEYIFVTLRERERRKNHKKVWNPLAQFIH